ncbi:MAG: NADH-quinone oxidoreductase subunit M [Candidatus Bathyarchaeia archaeon]
MIVLQSIIMPMIASIFTLALGERFKEKVGWIAFIASLFSTILVLNVALEGGCIEIYPWTPTVGDFKLVADGISIPIAITISLLCTVIAVYSISYMKHEEKIGAYFTLLLLYEAGMIGTVFVANLIFFFLFYELMLLPSWALIAIWGTGAKERIALKYFIFTEAGALSLLGGIASTKILSGTFDIFEIANATAGLSPYVLVPIASAMLLGFFVKMALFPLHTWLPDAHAEAPTPISALLSPAMIGLGGYASIRVLYTCFPSILNFWWFATTLTILALTTLIYGSLMVYVQDDIKRFLAFSSISQMGYMFFGIASLSTTGVLGAILIYINHGLCKAVLFMVSGVFSHEVGTRRIKELSGIASKMPYTTVAAVISFLGLAGVPPLVGFWAELYIFTGSIYTALKGSPTLDIARLVLTVVAIISAILTAGYGLWTIRRVFSGKPSKAVEESHEPPMLMLMPLLILAVLAIVLGVYPSPLMDLISSTTGVGL